MDRWKKGFVIRQKLHFMGKRMYKYMNYAILPEITTYFMLNQIDLLTNLIISCDNSLAVRDKQ